MASKTYGRLELEVTYKDTVKLDSGVFTLPLASFRLSEQYANGNVFHMVTWYVKEFHPTNKVVYIRANGHARVLAWLAQEPVIHGIRYLPAA